MSCDRYCDWNRMIESRVEFGRRNGRLSGPNLFKARLDVDALMPGVQRQIAVIAARDSRRTG
jgi:hypothetical protein